MALIVVLLIGAYFRFTGLTWGDYEYQHPDERFLIWVVADIAPVDSLGEYFNTQASPLNPANRGHSFYVYGDLPVILTRYLAEAYSQGVGWEQILEVGRSLSAIADLFTVLLVYLIARRLCGWKWATLAGLFDAAAVLQIQQAHFFCVDSFAATFTTLAIYFAVVLATEKDGLSNLAVMRFSLWFGAAVGLAMACKLNTAPVALLLPVALGVRWLRQPAAQRERGLLVVAGLAAAGGLAAFLVFRVAQPYAFSGPGFLNVIPDQGWMNSIREQRNQAAGDVDFPPSLQWARRSHLFSLENMLLWGLGLPLGLLAWAGFFLFAYAVYRALGRNGWHMLLGARWSGTLLVWGWTAVYFTWQSMAWNPTMRYQLPVYPTLAVLAAWGLGYAWNRLSAAGGKGMARYAEEEWNGIAPAQEEEGAGKEIVFEQEEKEKAPARTAGRRAGLPPLRRYAKVAVGATGALVLLLTLAWAFAFTRIYTRTETRVAASRWIFENVPGPLNLTINSTQQGTVRQLVPLSESATVRAGQPYITPFDSQQAGALDAILLSSTQVNSAGDPAGALLVRARIVRSAQPDAIVAQGELSIPDGAYDQYELPLTSLAWIEPGQRYSLILETGPGGKEGDAGVPGSGFAALQLSGQVKVRFYARVQQAPLVAGVSRLEAFQLTKDGTLRGLRLAGDVAGPGALYVIASNPLTGEQLNSGAVRISGGLYRLDTPLPFSAGVSYLAAITAADPAETLNPATPVQLEFLDDQAVMILPALTNLAREDWPLWTQFSAHASGQLSEITLGYAAQVDPQVGPAPLLVEIANQSSPGETVSALVTPEPPPPGDPRGKAYTIQLEPPLEVQENQLYNVILTPLGAGAVSVRGSAPANESTWDMGLPFRLSGYDPYGGIYRSDLNFEMYWDDNAEKYQRFTSILDNADYIFMSSNRQWGTTTRLPERHPLTTEFYRALLGCPEDKEVIWCYNVATPGMFEGQLGFDLVKTFTSYPNLGPLELNTQFAEEAFTVYDHPKVMLFRKRADYDPAQVRAVLGKVDLDIVVHISPKQAARYKNMLLPAATWAVQQAGGTWARLFPPQGLQNRYPGLGLVIWYGFLCLLGVVVYPLLRLALPALADRGYPLGRIAGLLLLAYLAWLAGSVGVPVTRATLGVIFVGLCAVGVGLGVYQRAALLDEWRTRRGYFLRVELIALVLFAISLLIRLGNPDLWHPIYGGEKPMDFSQLNAVLKSTLFPAYDPWFAGGALNYYYFGYVLVGMPVKLLGIMPSVAYNLILPALFSMVGLAAFSIVYNLAARKEVSTTHLSIRSAPTPHPFTAGIFAVFALLLLGNLGTARMLWEGPQKLVVSEEEMRQGNLFQHVSWVAQGVGKLVSGEAHSLPYYPGDWYWKPSRAIQPESGNEITEFPFFTFLYGDLHAHLMALPLTLLGLAWALSVLLAAGRWQSLASPGWLSFSLALLLGALVFGALRPSNTWDQYTYLALGCLALLVGQWQASRAARRQEGMAAPLVGETGAQAQPDQSARNLLRIFLPPLLLVGLAVLLFRPFDWYFGQGYNQIIAYEGAKTSISSYLVHWGLFLFVIAAWLYTELIDWLAAKPLSHLNRLRPYKGGIITAAVFLLLVLAGFVIRGVAIVWIAGPLGLLAALLLFRPGQPLEKRAVLLMTGAALALTLAVELVAVKGDINRMNTVFKFYYQAWTLLSLSAAAALGWLVSYPARTGAAWTAWRVGLGALVFCATLYPITATQAKINDRMTPEAPHTLDGMDYMAFTRYTDGPTAETEREMDLNQDYYAIRWMQQNISGSPVIVEANTPEYRHWGTRFTIYTGLPAVIGWNWHERQQRALTPDTWVYKRIAAVTDFYNTTSAEEARAFLEKYNVGLVVVGQLERIYYPGPGLEKFTALEGELWDKIYSDGETEIYQVR
jgi:YYY domain-containing protein